MTRATVRWLIRWFPCPTRTIGVRTLLLIVSIAALGLAAQRECERRQAVAELMAILGPSAPNNLPVCGTGARYLGPFPLADRVVEVHGENLAAPQLVRTYRRATDQQDDGLEHSALHALLRIEPLAAVFELKRKREHGQTRQDKADAISWMAITASTYESLEPLLRAAILEAVDDPDPSVGCYAADKLADILVRDDDSASREKLAELLRHPSEPVRAGAARRLAEQGLKPGESLLAFRDRMREKERTFKRLVDEFRAEAELVLYPPHVHHPTRTPEIGSDSLPRNLAHARHPL